MSFGVTQYENEFTPSSKFSKRIQSIYSPRRVHKKAHPTQPIYILLFVVCNGMYGPFYAVDLMCLTLLTWKGHSVLCMHVCMGWSAQSSWTVGAWNQTLIKLFNLSLFRLLQRCLLTKGCYICWRWRTANYFQSYRKFISALSELSFPLSFRSPLYVQEASAGK